MNVQWLLLYGANSIPQNIMTQEILIKSTTGYQITALIAIWNEMMVFLVSFVYIA